MAVPVGHRRVPLMNFKTALKKKKTWLIALSFSPKAIQEISQNNSSIAKTMIREEEGLYTTKFNSRKFLETANSTGGHRASHKKPKATHNDERKKNLSPSSDEEDGGHYNNVSPLCLQLSDNNTNRGTYSSHNKGKIHECSVCGAEFTSGQALGGHMRRHRGPLLSSTATLSLTPLAIESEKPKKARNALSLDLDLNLPAPEDEKSSFASKQQQQHHQQPQQNTPLVFSSPALVGCHY
ncbi:C2H2-TYPE ZINC FINGER PROTEIN [Salix koriyanagi]|uniref:C2H2-TYPE ZINC FINGER PROTEIN n=1 Tax=Salix koriyanagi TaxID=2511006 RepID=A0A9Q1AIT7_9ROSI|nr:C2H2-TYPE ZINC FINGER PROTEIN [Salix koriyanagi]